MQQPILRMFSEAKVIREVLLVDTDRLIYSMSIQIAPQYVLPSRSSIHFLCNPRYGQLLAIISPTSISPAKTSLWFSALNTHEWMWIDGPHYLSSLYRSNQSAPTPYGYVEPCCGKGCRAWQTATYMMYNPHTVLPLSNHHTHEQKCP